MKQAIVLFSGGQDSTTCLYWAKQNFDRVEALFIQYGQRHAIEQQQARTIAQLADAPLTELDFPALHQLGGNALVDASVTIQGQNGSGLPNTFVPGRNLFFLGLAAARAYTQNAHNLVGGMCETDYSGYPDCRRGFIDSLEETLGLAMDYVLEIHTPLMQLNKAETWKLAQELGCLEVVVEHTHTCYQGDRSTRHVWGYGCGECPACNLRANGWRAAFGQESR